MTIIPLIPRIPLETYVPGTRTPDSRIWNWGTTGSARLPVKLVGHGMTDDVYTIQDSCPTVLQYPKRELQTAHVLVCRRLS